MCSDYVSAHLVVSAAYPLSHIDTKAEVTDYERLFYVELPPAQVPAAPGLGGQAVQGRYLDRLSSALPVTIGSC
jgi:hypothetical protein